MDGNFVSEHLQMQNPNDDVALADGHGFFVTCDPYEEHIKAANDTREVSVVVPDECSWLISPQTSQCHDHRAVNNMNRGHAKNLDSTGIGASACARHGCFFPHSVVDFQKGER